MLDERLGLEGLAGQVINPVNEHLVQSLLVCGLPRLVCKLLQLLNLLAIELLEIGSWRCHRTRWWRGRRRGRLRRHPPHMGDDGVGEGRWKLKLVAGILDGEVDSGLHFVLMSTRVIFVRVINPFSENGFLSARVKESSQNAPQHDWRLRPPLCTQLRVQQDQDEQQDRRQDARRPDG